MGRGDQVGGVRRSLGVSESLLRQSLLEIDTATFARMVSRGLLHGKTFLSRPLTVRIYFKFSVTQFDNVLCTCPSQLVAGLGAVPIRYIAAQDVCSTRPAIWSPSLDCRDSAGVPTKSTCRPSATG